MRAAVLTGPGQVDVIEAPEPDLQPGSVIVEVERCGISGSDIVAWQTGDLPAPAWFGHEWVGRVVAVGADSPGRFEGERVVGGVPAPCGACRPCRSGIGSICQLVLSMIVGTDHLAVPHGAFAERIRVDSRRVHRLPEGVDSPMGALAEPAAVAAHAVRRAQPSLGDVVVVIGTGTIGLLVAELARLAGASRVVAVDTEESRRELACSLGADAAFAPGNDLNRWLAGQSHGLGADLVVDCAGGSAALTTGVGAARVGATVLLVGFTAGSAVISADQMLRRELTVIGSLGYSVADVHRALDLMADERYRVDELTSYTVGFSELADTVCQLASPLEQRSPEVANRPKVLFSPTLT